jgi:hypothetical protein
MNHTHADARRECGSGGPATKESSLKREEAVRNVRVLAIAAALLLACAAGPACAGSPVAAPDSAWTTDTALLRAPAAATDTAAIPAASVSDGAPSPAEIVTVRERVNHPVVRVFRGQDAYDVRGARFDSRGVAFVPANLRGVPAWDNGGPYGDYTRPARLASPIGWDRIDRITMRKPCALRGAVVGGLVSTAAAVAIFGRATRYGEGELGTLVSVLVLPALGGLVGGAIGAFRWRSEPVWQRAGTEPGSARRNTGSTAQTGGEP